MTPKVYWLIYGALEQPTGGYVYDRLIVERLRALGVQVDVRALTPRDPAGLAATVTQLLDEGTDVVVGDALCVNELAPLFEAVAKPVQRLLLVHHLASWERESSASLRATLRAQEMSAVSKADWVVTTSVTTANRLRAEYPDCVPYVILPGADRLRRLPRVLNLSQLRLLGIGSLIPRKRWNRLLSVLEKLLIPELCLRLVGDDTRAPEYSRKLAEQIAQSPYLATHVKYLGVIDDRELERELAAADATILPSSLEGYGMVLTEALHAGVPVIASSASAVSADLTRCDAALLFEDDAELLVQLNRFVNEPSLRSVLLSAAEASAATLPTWASAGDRFRGLLATPFVDTRRDSRLALR